MQSTILRSRAFCVKVRADNSPFERHRTKVRELIKEIQVRREKSEKVNTDFLLKNQVILKQIIQDEIEYIKQLCKPPKQEIVTKPIEPEIVVSDDDSEDAIIADSIDEQGIA